MMTAQTFPSAVAPTALAHESVPSGRVASLRARFARSQAGVAALEFALVSPMVILLLLGGVEIGRYTKNVRQITNVATSIAQMIAQNTSGTINDTDLHFFIDSTMLTFPDLLSASAARGQYWWQNISVGMSSVAFTPTVSGCTSNCTYTAKVVWSSWGARPCSTLLTPAPNSAQPTPTTLPQDAYGPGSIIVVDVSHTYRPSIGARFLSNIVVKRSFYIQPRYVATVQYQADQDYSGTQCPS